jgi:hypothetical protein
VLRYRPIVAVLSSFVRTHILTHPRSRPTRFARRSGREPNRTADSLHDGNLVQEEFATLIRVEDFDCRHEPCRLIVNIAEERMMPLVLQEPSRLFEEHLVVERLLEPSDLSFIAWLRPMDPNLSLLGIFGG